MIRKQPTLIRPIIILWSFTFLGLLGQTAPGTEGILAAFFLVTASIVWSALFCIPVYLLSIAVLKLAPINFSATLANWSTALVSYLLIVFLVANFKLYSLYGFYTNYFVINLISTPGGIDAMGISASTWNSAIGIALIGVIVFFVAVKYLVLEKMLPHWLTMKRLVASLLLAFAAQSSIYIYADYANIAPVLNKADQIIWYVPITAGSLMTDLGIPHVERFEDELEYSAKTGNLNYFESSLLTSNNPGEKLNIVWLVAESLRADMVTPEIMPNTYSFANEQQWFENHYSGGNGTRMGMFTQFYGLYGHYWFDVLRNRRPPLLMEQLRIDDYKFKAITSSAFTYPEFDKTIFSALDPRNLQEFNEGHGWERDQKNTTDLVSFIESSDDPFFAFMFFESSHANYYFPDEDIIEEDYIDDFNYLTVDITKSMPQIKSRYINATHHLDRQLARVFQSLEENNLMDSTIVVVTGDHGEEFMENGRWGHNSTFSQQQIRVPMILHIPGVPAARHNQMSSHLDMPSTILSALGHEIEPTKHSFGRDLLDPEYDRDFTVISDWHGNTLITPDVKIIFSLKGAAYQASTTDLDDQPLDLSKSAANCQTPLGQYLQQQNLFFN